MKKKIFMSIKILVLLVLIVLVYLLYRFNYIPHKKYSNEDFKINTYISSIDKDNDGIDDQTDILDGVKKYIATKPKYKSKYYSNGYPDDEYGVCTDVVAYGLLNAGYDLKELLAEDILINQDSYDIDAPDKNIDFRRVKNLKVYFDNNALSLTTDIYDIKEWQGGDIVVFNDHIGIVSENRNKDGVSFIIHHANPYQKYYEEDVLGFFGDIVGHYRIS